MKNQLALFGGEPVINYEIPRFNTIGEEEINAVKKVMETGVLSKFLGSWHNDFYGGEKVQEFEKAWSAYFKVEHSVSVNSATSGLIAALGAIGIAPGDEVIVSPWTMSASATAILVWNAIPVFVDIEKDSYNLDPNLIENKISENTKAIIVPSIFGQAANLGKIMQIAKKYNLYVIEDAAQSPGALYYDRFVGTIGDIGIFSLNYHKHIHTGEGGICVTNNPNLAERLQLIRNHAEAVVAKKKVDDYSNLIGFNFRLGEIEAAIGLEQLKKLKAICEDKINTGERLKTLLSDLSGLGLPAINSNCTHVFYVFSMLLEVDNLNIERAVLLEALQAEGVPGLMNGYANIHMLPIYQMRRAYGKKDFPWSNEVYKGHVSYEYGICPVAENYHEKSMLGFLLSMYELKENDLILISEAFRKVWRNIDMLKARNCNV